jgi:mycothiol synthase
VTVRRPERDELHSVLELMRAHDAAAWGDSDWTEPDLREHWNELDLQRDAWVVQLDGRVAGYVDFEGRPGGRMIADGYVDPQLRGRGVGSALVEAAERRAGEEAAQGEGHAYLHYAALLSGDGTEEFFRRRGFHDVRHQWRMVARLESEPAVDVPPGIAFRLYRAGEEGAIHAAIDDAWSAGAWLHEPRPYADFAKGTFARAEHDPSLYWVAMDGREIAGALLADWKRNGNWGWINTLGVRPTWRRRGIGEALLRTAFAEFFRRGERVVALQVDAESPTGATRLYERAGMDILYRIAVYEKVLRAA